jgi:hypothetical protein
LATINDKYNDICLDDSLTSLLGHLVNDALFRDWLKTSGIDHQKRTLTDSPFTVVTVPSQSRQVGN